MRGGRPVTILGTGQFAGGDNSAAHAAKCEEVAFALANLGGVDWLTMNRSLRTSTGLETLGAFAGKRPDVFGVKRGANGSPVIYLREVQSPSQTPAQVDTNLQAIAQALRNLGFEVDALPIYLPY